MNERPTFGSLFSGIGGLDLGLERAGWECRWQVEIDEWCRRVLEKHWPDVARWDDAREFPCEESWAPYWAPVDLICGGFPCQPVSLAGRQRGQEDERWLWPEFARIVRRLRPRYVLVENVPGLLARGMGDVLGELAACGYDAEWDCLPAAAVGAPHLRYRVFIVAHARSEQLRHEPGRGGGPGREGSAVARDDGTARDVANAEGISERSGLREGGPRTQAGIFSEPVTADGGWWATEPDVGRVAHGVPSRVDRLRGLGNAVVPQVAEYVGRRLMEAM